MHTGSIIVLITIFVYLVGMVLIGVYYGKSNSSTSEFYLGGRTLGPYVTAMSAEASDMSSYLLMGIPGLAYLSGMAHAGWTIAGLAIGTYFNWLFTAQRLRRYTHITDSFTFPQFLSHRFHEEKNVLAAIGAVVIVIFFVPYTASGFAACGKVFSTLLGLDYTVTMVVSAIVIVSYIAIGGFLAVSMTDFIQSIIMSVAIFFVVGFAVVNAGGVDIILDNARALPGYLSATLSYDPTTDSSTSFGLLSIITTLSWGLGYFGMPHILLRFMAIEDEQKLKVSRRVGTGWVILAMALAVCIGIAGHTLSLEGVIPMLEGSASENILIEIANLLSGFGVLAAIMGGIVISGILASTMSTASSQLLAAASSVSQDIVQETFHIRLTDKQSIGLARLTVVLISVLGIIIARNPDSSVFQIVSFAWAGFGASFGPLIICALYWKRTTWQGGLAGMIVGGAMVFIWKYLIAPMGGVFAVYELLPAFLLSLAAIVLVSLATKAPDKSITDEFELAAAYNKPIHK